MYWVLTLSVLGSYVKKVTISQRDKINLKMSCHYYHSDLFCDITLCLATKINWQLRSILALCEIGVGFLCYVSCGPFIHNTAYGYMSYPKDQSIKVTGLA